MKTKYMQRFALSTLALCAALSAQAVPVFQDDFESGNLNQWEGKNGGATFGQIIADPLPGSTHGNILDFSAPKSGGDLYTKNAFGAGSYNLSFDYFGAIGTVAAGGFIGTHNYTYDPGSSKYVLWGQAWLAGSGSPAPNALTDDGTWHHYSIDFTKDQDFKLMVEDFLSPGGNARFDNVVLNAPEGGQTAWLLAASLVGFAVIRSRMVKVAAR